MAKARIHKEGMETGRVALFQTRDTEWAEMRRRPRDMRHHVIFTTNINISPTVFLCVFHETQLIG